MVYIVANYLKLLAGAAGGYAVQRAGYSACGALMRVLLFLLAVVGCSVALANPPALVSAARQQTTGGRVVYDGRYTRIGYPMGDVPQDRGVCTDVVIRAYRALGIDLQVLVHEDMSANLRALSAPVGIEPPGYEHRPPPRAQSAAIPRTVEGEGRRRRTRREIPSG